LWTTGRKVETMSDASWSTLGGNGTHRYEAAALSVYWPEEQFRILIARWPVLAAQLGATWDEHRQRVEQHCASVQQAGLLVQQLPADMNEFATYLAANQVTTPREDDLAACAPSQSHWSPGLRHEQRHAGAALAAGTSSAAAGTDSEPSPDIARPMRDSDRVCREGSSTAGVPEDGEREAHEDPDRLASPRLAWPRPQMRPRSLLQDSLLVRRGALRAPLAYSFLYANVLGVLVKTMSYSESRARYAEVLDSVVDDREEVVITRAGREPVVMVSLEDYESLKETAYLLRSPENARRLLASIERLESGQGLPRDLAE
jgi:antitoxin YefM